ncbi:MAG: ester cyclase [Chloroflexota bacterium]
MATSLYRQMLHGVLDAWNAHDVDHLVEFFSPDYIGYDVAQSAPVCGLEGISISFMRYLYAFPDIHFTPDQIVIEDDQVTMAWTACGTHQGKFMHIPPTNRYLTIKGVSILTFSGNKIVRGQYIWDVAGLLRGLGLLPEL